MSRGQNRTPEPTHPYAIRGTDDHGYIWLMWSEPTEPIGWATNLHSPDGTISPNVVVLSDKATAEKLANRYGGEVVRVADKPQPTEPTPETHRYVIIGVEFFGDPNPDRGICGCENSECAEPHKPGHCENLSDWECEFVGGVCDDCEYHMPDQYIGDPIPPVIPPISANPWNWLYGEDIAETLGLPARDSFHDTEPEQDEYGLGRWVYGFQTDGFVELAAWEEFADRHYLPAEESQPNLGMLTEFGFMPGFRWNEPGHYWNIGGWSPVLEVSISVSATPREVEQNPGHFGFVPNPEEQGAEQNH